MIPAAFDCCMVASGLGWSGNPRFCLDLVFAQQVLLCASNDVWNEYAEKIPLILAAKKRTVDAPAMLAQLLRIARFVEPAPLGKQRSRALKDDRYIACALAAHAEAIVTSDRDLLVLGKLFGLPILSPVEFIKLVRASGLT